MREDGFFFFITDLSQNPTAVPKFVTSAFFQNPLEFLP